MIKIPKKLIEAYTKKSFGFFIGAGISQSAGLPSWEMLLNELIDLAVDINISSDKEKELRYLSKVPSKYLLVAEELKEILSSDMPKFITKRFNDKNIDSPASLDKLVKELNYRFIITTNYDNVIEKSFVKASIVPNELTYRDAPSINHNFINDEIFILKAHGDAKRAPEDIIITEKDYRRIIFAEYGYQSILQALFSTNHILFLGVSLNDPELLLLLGYIHNIFQGGSPDHFALMSNENLTDTEINRWRKDFNINIIPYDPKGNHIEVENFIDSFIEKVT